MMSKIIFFLSYLFLASDFYTSLTNTDGKIIQLSLLWQALCKHLCHHITAV